MNRLLLRAYHALPYPIRCAAAGWYGRYLNRWRYDARTERLIEEALEREQWTASQWGRWREEKLGLMLHIAATRVPYYRDYWSKRRRRGDRSSPEILENWPILDKEQLRLNPQRFLAEGSDPRRMFAEHTSGTTGTPLTLWRSRETVRNWYALHEARCRHWYGVTRQDRWAILGGRPVVPATQRNPPFWVWNSALNQLYLSAFHVSPQRAQDYLEAMQKYKVQHVLGYSASIAMLAGEALRSGRQQRLKVVVTNAEPLTSAQRAVIQHGFQCPVRETYGLAEMVTAASECECGQLHEWPEAGWMEAGEDGELIATGLLTTDMPLIRYRTGDRRQPSSATALCGCARLLPLFGTVEGRKDDVVYLRDGREIGRMDPVFKTNLPIREAQIIQETLDQLRVRYVPAEGFNAQSAQQIIGCIQDYLGPVQVVLEQMAAIPREQTGKFRAVICRIPREQRPELIETQVGAQ
ncbi:MAG TPA: AMP-binding protein [Bryobacteraceae bacterium]|nr:AMP-binding protein [Bryobacteraceae bacterium]